MRIAAREMQIGKKVALTVVALGTLATTMTVAQAPPPKPRPAAPAAQPAPRPKFDVASVKPCDPNATSPGRGGTPGRGATARFRQNCVDVETLIAAAYIRFAGEKPGSLLQMSLTKIEGGPAWLSSDKYTIEAEADGDQTVPMMYGPMTQVPLEERFQLKIHRETREGPVYELTIAKGGARVQPVRQGPCLASDFAGTSFPFRPGDESQCRFIYTSREGPNIIATGRSRSMEELTQSLTTATDRLVIDKTGITGNVDYHVVFAVDESTPGFRGPPPSPDGTPVAEDPVGPSVFTAVEQQLGLKLNPARGARDYLVIDSISRPTPN